MKYCLTNKDKTRIEKLQAKIIKKKRELAELESVLSFEVSQYAGDCFLRSTKGEFILTVVEGEESFRLGEFMLKRQIQNVTKFKY